MNSEKRIESLEGQVKTLKRMFYGFGCLVVAGIALAATSMQGIPAVIEAKQFRVVNEGKVMALLTSAPEDGGALFINNKDGKTIARLFADPFGGTFGIYNKDEKKVAGLFVNTDGGGLFGIYNKDEKNAVSLAARPEGGSLDIWNKDRNKVFQAP